LVEYNCSKDEYGVSNEETVYKLFKEYKLTVTKEEIL